MQPGIRITRAEVETLGGFLMAARGAIAIRHPAAATSAIDAARAILDRVSGEQDDPPAAEPRRHSQSWTHRRLCQHRMHIRLRWPLSNGSAPTIKRARNC